MLENIRTFGILQPPLLLELEDKSFIVLSGRKRIQAAAAKPDTHITVLIIDRIHAGQQEVIFSILLQHQLIGSKLSIIEQAVFFKKALALMPAENILQFLPMMGYKKKPHIPDELISLLKLELSVQMSLHRGTLTQRAGKKFLLLSPADQQAVVKLIEELQLGGSKQQKIVDQILELTKRLRISAVELLDSWLNEEKDKQTNGPQKAASLLRWLRHKCSPRSAAEEENFTKFCRQLQLPPQVSLEHTLSFEDKKVTLSIEFSSREQLRSTWPRIKPTLQLDHDS